MKEDMEDESPKVPTGEMDGLLTKLKNYLFEYYAPVYDPKEAEFHLSTDELYRQMLKLYPNELLFQATHVAQWLHEGGFTFFDFGEFRFEWLLKRRAF